MRNSIAVVKFAERGVRLLVDCRIEGDYGYIGVNLKQQVIRMESGDEVAANLSLGSSRCARA